MWHSTEGFICMIWVVVGGWLEELRKITALKVLVFYTYWKMNSPPPLIIPLPLMLASQ